MQRKPESVSTGPSWRDGRSRWVCLSPSDAPISHLYWPIVSLKCLRCSAVCVLSLAMHGCISTAVHLRLSFSPFLGLVVVWLLTACGYFPFFCVWSMLTVSQSRACIWCRLCLAFLFVKHLLGFFRYTRIDDSECFHDFGVVSFITALVCILWESGSLFLVHL